MANLFTFSLETLAHAISGRATLDDTRFLFGVWPQLFPQLAPQEQQLDRNEFAVYLTAVARDSRSVNGPNWNRPNALAAVRASFLSATSPITMAAAGRRALGAPAPRRARKTAAKRPARRAGAGRTTAVKRGRGRRSR